MLIMHKSHAGAMCPETELCNAIVQWFHFHFDRCMPLCLEGNMQHGSLGNTSSQKAVTMVWIGLGLLAMHWLLCAHCNPGHPHQQAA